MRWVVVGAGAIGGTLGGLLSAAGQDVVLVARGEHAQVMRRDGLRLARPDGVLTVRPPVVEAADLEPAADDLLVLATKSQASAGLLTELAGLPVGGRTAGEVLPVLCAQNGVSNEPEALRRFAAVHGACVMLPAVHLEPGRVEASGWPLAGLLEVGRYPAGRDEVDRRVVDALSASGFGGDVRADVMAWKRAKLLRNLANALEALGGHDLDEAGQAASDELAARARHEGEAGFSAAGLSWVRDDEWDANRTDRVQSRPVEGRERGGGSTWQSVTRGLGSVEADHLNGEVVLLGRLHGVDTPVNALLQREVGALARRGEPAGSVSLPGLLTSLG